MVRRNDLDTAEVGVSIDCKVKLSQRRAVNMKVLVRVVSYDILRVHRGYVHLENFDLPAYL